MVSRKEEACRRKWPSSLAHLVMSFAGCCCCEDDDDIVLSRLNGCWYERRWSNDGLRLKALQWPVTMRTEPTNRLLNMDRLSNTA